MHRRFILGLGTFLMIVLIAVSAVFLAKGYRISPGTGTITGTGIMSITSIPDQASVYLDGHLTTATNANVNSLVPKTYEVRIVKEGFIDWQKKVNVKEGFVTEVKATLFRALPSVFPLTYTGAENVILSPDSQSIAFVVPLRQGVDATIARKSGIWVWKMSEQAINFARGAEPHQVAVSRDGVDFSNAGLRWSPDSRQILATLPDRRLLIDATSLNDPPQDITPVVQATLRSWEEDQRARDLTRLEAIKDLKMRQIASNSAVLKWSPDESKILYCERECKPQAQPQPTQAQSNYKVFDFLTNKTFDMPLANFYSWTADSEHIILSETQATDMANQTSQQKSLSPGKISIVEYDGFNRAEIYAGNFNPETVIPWPDGSRLVILSSFPTATASKPNLYGINLR